MQPQSHGIGVRYMILNGKGSSNLVVVYMGTILFSVHYKQDNPISWLLVSECVCPI